ncbi:putative ABC transporter substrate binding protein [Gordonia effusa NBRC 100432]|uniref:Putative ABC transporter substrate binding protein n=1 Tax=Gordonia effusa NBRC 100432 TaxID=1077974 RepID=H0QW57_9ACTN|nr:ABC transporter family substrate-binding protein [Gordonia effusa]GAB17058.1 putative ABC transporter substrate binding protein [Gordonia effusa NBRC 100432]
MRARWLILVVALATSAALVAGCGVDLSGGGSTTSTEPQMNFQPRENVRDGGSLTTAIDEVSPQWNTFHADGSAYTQTLWRWYNPMLAYFAPDGEYSFNRDYLTDVQTDLVDGNTRVTYTINPKARYNDGTPIDWRAFVNTWLTNRGVDPNYVVSSSDGYNQIASVTRGVDDRQAVVRFNGVWAWPNGLFNMLVHPKVNTPDLFNKAYLQAPHNEWGAGPYIVSSYDVHAGIVVFARNPKWWGKPGKLDRRVFRQMEDVASINAFSNGELDAIGVSTKDSRARVLTMPKVDIRTSATPQKALMVVNLDADILGDRRVREALLRGVDRETLARIRFTGLNYSEPLPGSLVMYPFQPGYTDNVTPSITYDQVKARALLDEAGWRPEDGEIRRKDGKELKLTLPLLGDSPVITNVARALQAMLKQIGINLDLVVRPSSDFSRVIINKEFDVFLMGFSSGDPYGMAYFCQVWCKGSQLNKAGAGSTELDAEIARVAAIADPAEQIKAGNLLERKAFAQYSDLPLFNGPQMVAVKHGLANYGAGLFYVGPVEDVGWQK